MKLFENVLIPYLWHLIYNIIFTVTSAPLNVAYYDKLALWQYNNASNLQPKDNTVVSFANIYMKGQFNFIFDISDTSDSPVPP